MSTSSEGAAQPARDCLVCRTPLSGALGALGRVAGIHRSAQNPNLCSRCDAHIEDGTIVEIAVLFADLTGFTPLTHKLGPERTHALVDGFLRTAKERIVARDGFVVQFAGDEVMAIFNVPIRREDFAERAVAAASEIQQQMPELGRTLGETLQATVGIAVGYARVGRLGSDHIKDYTAVGDVVNRAARLVSHAEPGDILVDAPVYAAVRDQFSDAPHEQVWLKGFEEPVEVVSLGAGRVPAAPPPPISSARALRIGTLAAAVLGAPCAGLMVLSPLIVGVGIGAAGFTVLAMALDQPAVRIPLLVFATGAALANLVAIAWARRVPDLGSETAPGAARIALGGRARPLGVLASSAALSVVVFEMIAHALMH